MEEILKIDTVDQYNKLFGFETRHPQVGVVSFDTAESQGNYRMTMGFYSVFLKETAGCRINYGKTSYDFDDQTVICIAPGQTVGYTDVEGIPKKSVGLLFHPDFIRGTSLGQKIKKYTFFSYESNEALHLSEEERMIVLDCLEKIRMELRHAIDKHTKGLIATNIELLLDYCMRFYERQFVTRGDMNLYEGDTQVSAVVRALENGPETKGLSGVLPEGFKVRKVWLEEEICCVSLSSALLEGQPEPETLSQAVLALEQSLLSLESVEEVRFLVDGELADTYGPIDLP